MKQTPPSMNTIIGWPQDLENSEKKILLDDKKQKDKPLS
jgi:hypothetical protein